MQEKRFQNKSAPKGEFSKTEYENNKFGTQDPEQPQRSNYNKRNNNEEYPNGNQEFEPRAQFKNEAYGEYQNNQPFNQEERNYEGNFGGNMKFPQEVNNNELQQEPIEFRNAEAMEMDNSNEYLPESEQKQFTGASEVLLNKTTQLDSETVNPNDIIEKIKQQEQQIENWTKNVDKVPEYFALLPYIE